MKEPQLHVKTSPGKSWFSISPTGGYVHASCVLGGCGSSVVTAEDVAKFLATVGFNHQDYLRQLEALGWNDVIVIYRQILSDKERGKLFERISELNKKIADAEPLYAENRHNDFSWWVAKIYKDLSADPDFDPDDFSIRRLHQAAQSAMSVVASLPKMKAELAELEEKEMATRNSQGT